MSTKKVVGLDDVIRALRIREGGGSWAQVIEATGFNGATLRPHITEYLQREVLGRAATNPGDRTDSPYAVVNPVVLSTESIDEARRRGMAWYSIAKALGVSEAKVKGLATVRHRVYATAKTTPAPAPAPMRIIGVAADPADYIGVYCSATGRYELDHAKATRNAKARARRAAKRAAA